MDFSQEIAESLKRGDKINEYDAAYVKQFVDTLLDIFIVIGGVEVDVEIDYDKLDKFVDEHTRKVYSV